MRVWSFRLRIFRFAILSVQVANELWFQFDKSGNRVYKLACLEFPHDPTPPRVSGVTITLLWLTATLAF